MSHAISESRTLGRLYSRNAGDASYYTDLAIDSAIHADAARMTALIVEANAVVAAAPVM